MVTQLSICNQALDWVGAQPIEAITDENVRAQACNRNYDQALAEILRSHPWNFAVTQATLTAATPPAFNWSFAFTLPTDYNTLLKLNGILFEGQPSSWFQIQGGLLLTNNDFADIEYISSTAAEALFDALFVAAFILLLASKIANPLRQDGGTDSIQLLQLYERALSKARMKSGNENRNVPRDPAYESQFVRSRWYQRRAP